MMSGSTRENTAITQELPGWQPTKGYRFHILITRDEDGGYSAIVLNLPGIGSCGDTMEEALENAKEAIQGALEVYKASGEAIPWKDTSSAEIPAGAKQSWITLNA